MTTKKRSAPPARRPERRVLEAAAEVQRQVEAAARRAAPSPAAEPAAGRWQDALIEREIPRGASVLDLGCGRGELLARLMTLRGVRGQGLELDPDSVAACVARGVPVFQSDLDEGLKGFSEGSFDYVVLEETLQTLHRPLAVLDEMLRVGRHGIVSFPNYAYWRVRLGLALEGQMPVTERLPYRWYDTPNIHLFTLQDFLVWAKTAGVRIVKAFVTDEDGTRPMREQDNLHAEEALFFVARPPARRRRPEAEDGRNE